jgi:hypothetical protein
MRSRRDGDDHSTYASGGEEAEQDEDTRRCTLLEREKERGKSLKICGFFFLFLSFRKEMSSVLLRKIATETENEGREFS